MSADQPTDRELAVLRAYLATGSVRAAANRLGLHEQTVKNQLASIRAKVNVRTTAQAVWELRDKLAA